MSKFKINLEKNEYIWSGLFLAPGFLFFLIFLLIPIFFSLYVSFFKWDLLTPMKFIGFNNYINLFCNDPKVRQVVLNTFIFLIEVVPISVFLPLIIAVLLSKVGLLKNFFQSVYFLPLISSNVAIALVWRWIFSKNYGLVNALISFITKENINIYWLGDTKYALTIISIIVIWKTIPLNVILFIAAVRDIPQELYESARLDGCSEFNLFKYITFPMASPTTFFVLILTLTTCFFNAFDIIKVLTQGDPIDATNIYVYYLYESAFLNQKMGYGSAISFVFFIFILFFTIFQFRLQKRWVYY